MKWLSFPHNYHNIIIFLGTLTMIHHFSWSASNFSGELPGFWFTFAGSYHTAAQRARTAPAAVHTVHPEAGTAQTEIGER
jgi:hypothetical protein